MSNAQLFASGYAHFAMSFLLMLVIGFVFACIKEFKAMKQEKAQENQAKTTAILKSLAKKCGHLTVEYNENFDTYYIFNAESGAFVAQNQNPLELLEYVRDSFFAYDLKPINETTALKMVSKVQELQSMNSHAA